jgi:putative phage-type endonuclease
MSRIFCEQGTVDWFTARTARVTASQVADAMSYLKRGAKNGEKGAESQARKDYKAQLVVETLTGISQENYVSPAMIWGTEQEPYARALYEVEKGVSVEQVGFFVHPEIDRFGASPDGLVGDDGLLEVKCPNSGTHLEYIINGVAPEQYHPQMLAEMACAERQWCDFVSYDPRMPKHLQLFVVRFFRDDAKIAAMEEEVTKFLAEVDDLLERLPKDDSPESIIAQAEAELVAKQVEEDMLLITEEDVCQHSQ